MIYVCENCGAYHPDKQITPDGRWAVCPDCGHRQAIIRKPLLIVTGASGAGKSSACEKLRTLTMDMRAGGAQPGYIVMEGDMLWNSYYAGLGNGDTTYAETWLRVCFNISQSGQSVLLAGCAVPSVYENCVARRYFSSIEYLALVCRPEVIAQRLRARPAWRSCGDDVTVENNVRFNNWFLENANSTQPRMTLLDTSDISREETALRMDKWAQSVIAAAENK